MSQFWYYADRAGQQQGPASAGVVRRAYENGELTAASLVWREGLPAWQPLSQHAQDIGLSLPDAPPPLPPPAARSGRPLVVAPHGGGSGVALLVVGALALIFILGILAAIAVPAYADYSVRARIAEGIHAANPLKARIETAFADEQRCLYNDDADVGAAESFASSVVERIVVGELEGDTPHCALQIHYHDVGGTLEAPRTLLMVLQAPGEWRYEASFPERYLPTALRND